MMGIPGSRGGAAFDLGIAERTAAALAHKKVRWKAYALTAYCFEPPEGRLAQNRREQEAIARIFSWR